MQRKHDEADDSLVQPIECLTVSVSAVILLYSIKSHSLTEIPVNSTNNSSLWTDTTEWIAIKLELIARHL